MPSLNPICSFLQDIKETPLFSDLMHLYINSLIIFHPIVKNESDLERELIDLSNYVYRYIFKFGLLSVFMSRAETPLIFLFQV